MHHPVVGDEVRGFPRVASFHSWNRFAAVNGEFVELHMDDEAARAAGFPGAIGMGNLQWAYLHAFLRSLIGSDGSILEVTCRFGRPALKDRRTEVHGRVTEVSKIEDGVAIILELWIDDDNDERIVDGTAQVKLGPTGWLNDNGNASLHQS
jgi:acyl dehydratase